MHAHTHTNIYNDCSGWGPPRNFSKSEPLGHIRKYPFILKSVITFIIVIICVTGCQGRRDVNKLYFFGGALYIQFMTLKPLEPI